MSSRGIAQLTKVKLCFCDFGGSSKGMREFVKTDEFYNFINKYSNINFEIYLRRGHHPFMRAMYVNGLQKDVALNNKNKDEIFYEFNRIRQNFGKRSVPHAGHKVTSYNKSIQGPWESNMWDTYPRHEILEFMSMKEPSFTAEEYGAIKPYVKKKRWETNTRIYKRNRETFYGA